MHAGTGVTAQTHWMGMFDDTACPKSSESSGRPNRIRRDSRSFLSQRKRTASPIATEQAMKETENRESGEGKRGPADRRFEREEMGALLRLFSALGITICAGVVGCFFAGLKLDARLAETGWNTRGAGKILGLLVGLGLGVSWAYMRIARHLKQFAPEQKPEQEENDHENRGR